MLAVIVDFYECINIVKYYYFIKCTIYYYLLIIHICEMHTHQTWTK